MEFFVYILQSSVDLRFYTGQTNNLAKRLQEHNAGKSSYTKRYIPWSVFAWKKLDNRAEAMNLERKLKNLKSQRKLLEYINRSGFVIKGSQEVTGPEK